MTNSDTFSSIPKASNEEGKMDEPLIATKEMCIHCFDVIIQLIQIESQGRDQGLLEHISEGVECPLFVTWEKWHHSGFRLRGCIGTLAPRPLKASIGQYAVTSAFRDSRFHPIRADEVSKLRVAVSLLVNYEDCNNCYDWDVGVHGIIIKFYFEGNHYDGTFLPEVSEQQNWDQEETVAHLVRKAGYRGDLSESLFASIHCSRYQSSKYRMTYKDYVKVIGRDPIRQAANYDSNEKG